MRRAERGFTLLELVIALAIVGALLTIAFGGLRVALAAWRKGEDRAEAHQHVRGIAVILARAVGASHPYQASSGPGATPTLLFQGTSTRLALVTQDAPFPFSVPIAFTAVVITVNEGERPGLVVLERPLPNRDPFTEAAVVFRDPAVKRLALRYLDEGGSWQDAWDGGDKRALPRAVRIELGTELDGRSETLPPLTVSLRTGRR